MNNVKIIATIGPASKDKAILKKIIESGIDVVRLNMSHADYPFCTDVIEKVRSLNEELNTHVAIMLDTKGPEVRVGKINGCHASLKKGMKIRIYMQSIIGDETKFSVNYPNLINDVAYQDIIKIDDGRIELCVISKEIDSLICEVLNDGEIYSGKGVSVPGKTFQLPFLSAKDKDDILFAHKMDVDFIALSYVSSSENILEVNDILIELNNDHIGLIAKVENEQAVNEIDNIIHFSDGIMIARGDLGVEIPMERVPMIQKSIIKKCHQSGKISIVATEMMSTMTNDDRPTRAEVSDVANAVLEGVDAVMLSGETTIGKYPVETVNMMERIIASTEESLNYYQLLDNAMRTEKQDTTGLLAYSVTECANRLKCRAIVVPTLSGYTAKKMSRFRPTCPIVALSPNAHVLRSLALHFGVHPVLVKKMTSFEDIIKSSIDESKQILDLDTGEKIIVTGSYPFKKTEHTNFMKIEEI